MDWKIVGNGALVAAILWGLLVPALSIPSRVANIVLGVLILTLPGLLVGVLTKTRRLKTGMTAAFYGVILGIPAMFIGAVFTDVERAGFALRVYAPLSFLQIPVAALCSELSGRIRDKASAPAAKDAVTVVNLE